MIKISIHPNTAKQKYAKNGKPVFRYVVNGTAEELKRYAEVQGTFHRIDDETKKPLFFSPRYVGKMGELREGKNKEGKPDFYPDDTNLVMFQSMVAQHGVETAKALWAMEHSVPVAAAEAKIEEAKK